jgi:hypothetical protein
METMGGRSAAREVASVPAQKIEFFNRTGQDIACEVGTIARISAQ